MDKVKLLRSAQDNTMQAKLEAMEWLARYTKFIPRQNVDLGAKAFKKEFMTGTQTELRAAMQNLGPHNAEGIQTILQSIRDAKNKLESDKIAIGQYDEMNYIFCTLLEGIVLNDYSNNMMA